jgi:hypothetical protein
VRPLCCGGRQASYTVPDVDGKVRLFMTLLEKDLDEVDKWYKRMVVILEAQVGGGRFLHLWASSKLCTGAGQGPRSLNEGLALGGKGEVTKGPILSTI